MLDGLDLSSEDEADLAIIQHAAEAGDTDAAAWLRGEGYIRVSESRASFVRWDDVGERTSGRAIAWRTAVFQRDGYRCQECGAQGALHAHHITPWAKDAERRFDVDNGVTLCVKCHALRHPEHAQLILKAHYHKPNRRGGESEWVDRASSPLRRRRNS